MSLVARVARKIRARRTTFRKMECAKLVQERSPVILDIGAHDGSDTVEWRSVYPEATIYAIEPSPDAYSKLLLKAGQYSINVFNIALSDFNGWAEFFISSGKSTQSSSLRKPNLHLTLHPDVAFSQSIAVPVRRLDDWAKENDVTQVDILWMDTQGTELEILKGGLNVVATVRLLHTEVAVCEMYDSQATYAEVRAFLDGAGFLVYKEFFGDPYNPGMGNVVFVRSR